MKLAKTQASVIIVVLFHAVGLAGFFITPFQAMFLRLVPFHLLLMLAVLIVNHEPRNPKFFLFAAIIGIAGFSAEWIGVHTNLLFGNYNYGKTLGTKLWNIPLMIGVNWFMLVYGAGVLMARLKIPTAALRIAIGATLLVLLDVLIEPVAIRYDYWSWAELDPPLKNFTCWFGAGALFLGVFELFKFKEQSIVAPVLLVVQFVFFGLMNLA